MAEYTVNLAVKILGSMLVQETKLLGNAKQGFQDIKLELESIRSFLMDADAKAAQEEEEGGGGGRSSQGVSTWVKQVREEAFRIEDVIDEYIRKEAKLPRGRGLTARLYKACCFVKVLKLRHGISTQIKEIKSSLADIQTRAKRYNFRSIDQGSSGDSRDVIPHDSRVGSFFIEDAEVVGIDIQRDHLIDLLLNGTSNRSVIAVVGEGGLGKTTLAGKIFNNDAVKKHFDCQAWITVGKEYTKHDLLRTIIMEFYSVTGSGPREMDRMPEKDLIFTVREQLKDKSYMIVFDDVWKIDFWKDVEHALLNNNKGSRVTFTTRNKAVVEFVPSSLLHVSILQPLPSDTAWELFCMKAFGSEGCCPPNLKELSENIIEKCGGLPLAIVAVGGLLSTKNEDIFEWQKLLEGLGSKLGSDPHLKSCGKVLSEGYYDLPHHLKSCLLYFSLFPESYTISCGRLIRLWIAEGFVPCSKHPQSEQVAEEYLKELIDRSLVQVAEKKASERALSCRVHDLMYEIILKKAKEVGFCCVLNGDQDLCHGSMTRRISINKSVDGVHESIKDSKIRSICVFNVDKLPGSFVTKFVTDFKLAKILDFEDAPIDCLPDGLGKLFHLHYLSLRNTKVKELPKSIGMLVNLETLDLKWSLVSELPVEIKNLKKLRCLLVRRLNNNGPYKDRAKIHEGIGALINLQKLRYVHANSDVIKELGQLRQLRKLGIRLENRDVKDLFAMVGNMENLEHLSVEVSTNGEDAFDIHSTAPPPRCLQRFYLGINIKMLPNWISQLQNLIRLELDLHRSTNDLMTTLQNLPNLSSLILLVNYCGDQLHIKEGWFLNLKALRLRNFRNLKMLMIEKGAMPNIRRLEIGPCPLMKEIPTGIEHLRKLKVLVFRLMLKEIYYMMKEENWEKVTEHVPEIQVSYRLTLREYFYYTTNYVSSLSPEDIELLTQE